MQYHSEINFFEKAPEPFVQFSIAVSFCIIIFPNEAQYEKFGMINSCSVLAFLCTPFLIERKNELPWKLCKTLFELMSFLISLFHYLNLGRIDHKRHPLFVKNALIVYKCYYLETAENFISSPKMSFFITWKYRNI